MVTCTFIIGLVFIRPVFIDSDTWIRQFLTVFVFTEQVFTVSDTHRANNKQIFEAHNHPHVTPHVDGMFSVISVDFRQ